MRLNFTWGGAEVEALAGTKLGEDSYDLLVQEDAKILKPDGSVLAVLVKGWVPEEACSLAWGRLLKASLGDTTNRGTASGVKSDYRILKDGTLSNTHYAEDPLNKSRSGIIGFMDRYSRFPYCRQTAYNIREPQGFEDVIPLLERCGQAMKEFTPDRYAAQMAVWRATSPDFRVAGTPFTTITVNRNWQTAVHKDAGDLAAGFGCMTALTAGQFTGCYFTFPGYRVAFDLQTTDVLLADVHEWHGNTPFRGRRGEYERVSLVMYYREKMMVCGSAQEELERAKRRKSGERLHED